MADTITKEKRSKNMAAIRSKDTKPEVYIRKLLFSRGFRYRKNSKKVFGHPDIYMTKYNLAVFVNGCFWHRHKDCRFAYMPKSRIEFWEKKFLDNINRDIRVRNQLEADSVRCLIIWECTIKHMMREPSYAEQQIDVIIGFINSSDSYMEI